MSKTHETFGKNFKAYFELFIVISLLICLLPLLFTKYPCKYLGICFNQETGFIGDTIGGTMGPFVAIMAAGLTFLAFWVQYQANEQQKADLREQKKRTDIEGVEARFMEMIKLHKENVAELKYSIFLRKRDPNTGSFPLSEDVAVSREVFKFIFEDFKNLHTELLHFFQNVNPRIIYEQEYLNQLRSETGSKFQTFDLITVAKIDILYCIVFFGLNAEDSETVENLFKGRYREDFYEPLIRFASIKIRRDSPKWKSWNNFMELLPPFKAKIVSQLCNDEKDINPRSEAETPKGWGDLEFIIYKDIYAARDHAKYYGGHQFRLGHYFRLIYQAVKHIDKSPILTYEQKYENIKLLRGQLSNYEQILFFLNSVSILGRVWELVPEKEAPEDEKHENWLITKYNLIKNIPKDEIVEGVRVSDFYPLVEYEAYFKPELKEKRAELKAKYKLPKA